MERSKREWRRLLRNINKVSNFLEDEYGLNCQISFYRHTYFMNDKSSGYYVDIRDRMFRPYLIKIKGINPMGLIGIDMNSSEAEIMDTLVHEYAHAFCGQCFEKEQAVHGCVFRSVLKMIKTALKDFKN